VTQADFAREKQASRKISTQKSTTMSAAMKEDANGDSCSAADEANHEETLKIMNLNTEEETVLFHKVLAWWEGRSLRLSIQVAPAVGAALLTRFLLAQGAQLPTNTCNPFEDGDDRPSPFVSPDEASPFEEEIGDRGVIVKRSMRSSLPRAKKVKDSVESQNDEENDTATEGMRNQFLFSLATDLAALLASNASKEEAANIPTVAYLASAYYFKFRGKDVTKPTEIATELVQALIDEDASEEDVLKFSLLLQQALQSLSRASKASVEAYCDFEYLWTSCSTDPSFREAMIKVHDEYYGDSSLEKNRNGKRPNYAVPCQEHGLKSTRELCWKLACLAEEEQKELKSGNASGRHRRILSAAACLGLVSTLPNLSPLSGNDDDSEVHFEAKQCAEDDETPEKDDCSFTSRASKKSRTLEEDAIDALSMMVKGRETATQELARQQATDTMDIVKNSVNDLQASLHPSFQNQTKTTLPELEHAALHTLKLFASSRLIPLPAGPSETADDVMEKEATNVSLDKNEADVSMDKETLSGRNSPEPSRFAMELKPLLPTKAERGRLVNISAINEAISTSVKKTVHDFNKSKEDPSFDGFPFVDEASLVSADRNILPFLCMVSSKASSSGVALISQYDEDLIVSSQGSRATAARKSLVSNTSPTRAMREAMDLNEWTASILAISDVRPRTKLLLYLETSDGEAVRKKRKRLDGVKEEIILGGGWRTVMTPLLNRVIRRLIDDVPVPGGQDEPKPRILVSEKDGSVVVHGDQDDVEVKLCKALVALYYQSLEALFYYETARLKSASHPKLIMNELFHRATLACCCVCLMKGLCSSSALALSEKFLDLDLTCIQQITESCPYTYLKVSESLARALKLYSPPPGPAKEAPQVLGLPRILQRQLSQCEVLVIDSLLWSQDPDYSLDLSVMDIVDNIKSMPDKGNGSSWPPDVLEPTLPEEIADTHDGKAKKPTLVASRQRPPDHLYLSYVIRKMLKIAFFRISAICSELSIPPEYPVASQVWIAFRYLLRHHIELLYDRHVDQLVLCTMYGVCKMMKVEPELSFSKIIEVYTLSRGSELGDRTCHRLVRHIKLISDAEAKEDPEKRQYGNIIQFYNALFVPALKNHLLQSTSLKKAVALLREFTQDSERKEGANHLSMEDCEAMAARADKLANDSGNWANEPKSVPVKEGNVKMNVLLPTGVSTNTFDPYKAQKKKKKKGKADTSAEPENRTFFSFGGISGQSISLMNRMAEA